MAASPDPLADAVKLVEAAIKKADALKLLRARRRAHQLCADCGKTSKRYATCQKCRIKRSRRRRTA